MDKAVNQCRCDRILIMGDFNYRDIDYNNYIVNADECSEAFEFFNKTQDLFLIQSVREATRKRSQIKSNQIYLVAQNNREQKKIYIRTTSQINQLGKLEC